MAPSSPVNPVVAAALASLAAVEDAPPAAGFSAPSGGEDEDEGRRLLRQGMTRRAAERLEREAVDSPNL